MEQDERYNIGKKISYITIIWNCILAVFKIIAGFIGKSNAIVADGVHTLSDLISTFAVLIGMKMANKPDDKDHPYGHEKIEPIVAMMLATLLILTGIMIGITGINNIINKEFNRPGVIAIVAALFSILVKEGMYRYTIKGAEKIESTALKADAWHHRSDALSSIGTLIGVVGARMGVLILDSIASIVVSVFIVKVAIDIYKQSILQIIDVSASDEEIKCLRDTALSITGVKRIDSIKTRVHASKIYVDIEIAVDGNMTLENAHIIAEKVHINIEKCDHKVKHCNVHVNPYK